jgi:hypothetical protein
VIEPAVQVQLLPDVIDISFVLTLSGGCGRFETFVAAGLQFDADRLARLALFGDLLGACIGGAVLPPAAAQQ